MNDATLYHVSMGIFGLSICIFFISTLGTGASDIGQWLLASGGILILLVNAYDIFFGNRERIEPKLSTWGLVIAAILTAVGVGMRLA